MDFIFSVISLYNENITLAAGDGPSASRAARVERARRHLLESCRQTLALFNECRLEGTRLPWRDRAEVAWLMVLGGLDSEAQDILDGILSDPELPAPAREELGKILQQIEGLPPEHAP